MGNCPAKTKQATKRPYPIKMITTEKQGQISSKLICSRKGENKDFRVYQNWNNSCQPMAKKRKGRFRRVFETVCLREGHGWVKEMVVNKSGDQRGRANAGESCQNRARIGENGVMREGLRLEAGKRTCARNEIKSEYCSRIDVNEVRMKYEAQNTGQGKEGGEAQTRLSRACDIDARPRRGAQRSCGRRRKGESSAGRLGGA